MFYEETYVINNDECFYQSKKRIFEFQFIKMTPEKQSPFLIKFSNIISNVLNPLFSLLIFFAFYSYYNSNGDFNIINFLLPIVIVIIPIFGWIFWNVKKGNYTNMDVSNRKQRNSLYLFNFFIISIYIAALFYTKQNFHYILIILFLLVLLVVMFISNFFIKSSMHTSFNIFVSALFFTLHPIYGFVWLLLTILVAISRVILKRHTVKEVIMGFIIATFISFVYLYFDINNH